MKHYSIKINIFNTGRYKNMLKESDWCMADVLVCRIEGQTRRSAAHITNIFNTGRFISSQNLSALLKLSSGKVN